MISHTHQCIFIHIPKCAGTSIEAALGHLDGHQGSGGQDHRTIRMIEKPVLKLSAFSSRQNLHSIWRRIRYTFQSKSNPRNRRVVTRRQFETYYIFSIVRNPWSRAFSWYQDVNRNDHNRRIHNLPEGTPFREFLLKCAGKGYLRTQLYWLKSFDGSVPLDFIGRFENLQDDFAHVCREIGIPECKLPHKLPGKNLNYRDHYDDEMIELVSQIYREEIEWFGYTFES